MIKSCFLSLLLMMSALSCQTPRRAGPPLAKLKTAKGVTPKSYFLVAHAPQAVAPRPKATESLLEATQKLQAQLKAAPTNVGAMTSLAQIHLGNGDLAAATKMAQAALAVDFRNRDAKISLAHVAYLQQNDALARAIAGQLGGDQANESELLNLQALLAWRDGDPALAEQRFAKAATKNPDDLAARMNLGLILLQRGSLSAAEAQFKAVLMRWSDLADAKAHLGITYALQKRYPEALALCKDALSGHPNNQLMLFNYAVVQERSKDFKGAIDTMKQFLALKNLGYASHDAALALLEDIRREKGARSKLSNEQLDQMVADETTNRSLSPPDEPGPKSVGSFTH